ncbi:MAG: EFR1 family ferrodoxin [Candidatus Coatesbacteria bacterium]|nr:EFR1 family ferrodoxin [Candidatus Coatesbacteria bacterium]
MSTRIYFFTGTGNTLSIAKDLAAEFSECELVDIAKAAREEEIEIDSDITGILYPVYYFGMPNIVKSFIGSLKGDEKKYIFSIANAGSVAGNALKNTASALEKQGLKLSAGFIVLMPGNYIPMYGAWDTEKQKGIYIQEKKRIKEIAGIVKQKKATAIETSSVIYSWFLSGIHRIYANKFSTYDNNFEVNDKCTSCRLCERICPVNNIVIEDDRPTWQHKCELCMACIQWCPSLAIEYSDKTRDRKRFQNPDIKIEEVLKHRT